MAQLSLSRDNLGEFFSPYSEKRNRAASYDVGVEYVMVDGRRKFEETVYLNPQHTAVLVSEEQVRMPAGHVGYALPKTSLCNKGILTLSTGIIDPGWSGRVSSIAINFSSEPQPISPGDTFLRIVIHELQDTNAKDKSIPYVEGEYLKDREISSFKLPNTFLDLPAHIDSISEQTLKRQTNYLLWAFAMGSFLVVLFTFAITFATGNVFTPVASELVEVEERLDMFEEEIGALREQIPPAASSNGADGGG